MKHFSIFFLGLLIALMTVNVASAKGKAGSASKVYIGVWGYIGDQKADLEVNGTTGWYYLSDNENAKRKLVLQSYNKRTGRVVLKAYYKGKFIGTLDGTFQEFDEPDHYGQTYNGKFKSVNGTVLEFGLYYD